MKSIFEGAQTVNSHFIAITINTLKELKVKILKEIRQETDVSQRCDVTY